MEMVYVSPKNWTIMAAEGRTLEEVLSLYPDAKMVLAEQAIHEVESAIICSMGGVVRTTKALFEEATYLRSPSTYVNAGHTESFAIKDRLFGNVARIYVRIGSQYFTLVERCTLDHLAIISLVTTMLLSEHPASYEPSLSASLAVKPWSCPGDFAFIHEAMSHRNRVAEAVGMSFNLN